MIGAAAALGAFLGLLAVRSWRGYRAAGQVVPGVTSRAPRSWAGSHSPEARLHRRLRDVVTALQALPHADATVMGGRAAVERHVLALDERLVAVAALPEAVRSEPMAQLTADVERLEAATAALASQLTQDGAAADEAFRELSEALSYLRDATAEIEALERSTPADRIPEMPSYADAEEPHSGRDEPEL